MGRMSLPALLVVLLGVGAALAQNDFENDRFEMVMGSGSSSSEESSSGTGAHITVCCVTERFASACVS